MSNNFPSNILPYYYYFIFFIANISNENTKTQNELIQLLIIVCMSFYCMP